MGSEKELQKLTNFDIFLAAATSILPSLFAKEFATIPHLTPPIDANAVTTDLAKSPLIS